MNKILLSTIICLVVALAYVKVEPTPNGFIGCIDGHIEVRNITITGLTRDDKDDKRGIVDLSNVRCATQQEIDNYAKANPDGDPSIRNN